MASYRQLVSLLDSKEVGNCCITENRLRYSNERIKLNAAFMYMKSLFVGPAELMDDQKWLLEKCFDEKGDKTTLGKTLFSKEFNDALTPAVLCDMETSFRATFNKFMGHFNAGGFDDDNLFNATRRYFKVKGKYLMATASKLRPPQVMCLRSTILNREDNFHKKACVMRNPEYVPEDDKEIDNLLDRIESSGSVTNELLSAIEANKVVAIAMMDKIMASCRSGKCIMMLIIMMINVEEKMDVNEALMRPMCLVDGIPLYNESAHFTSYIKLATCSIERYFGFGDNPDENRDLLRKIKNIRTLEELEPIVSDDCHLFSTLFAQVLLEEMPEHLKTDEMKDGGPCTWLYFLLSNVVRISAATWGASKKGLVFTSTPQALNSRHASLRKARRVYDTNGSSPIQLLTDELEQFGCTFVDEDDAGVGQGEEGDVVKLGGSLRTLVGRIIQNMPALAVSATGESPYYRLYMRYSAADAMNAGVIRKMYVSGYESEGVSPVMKLKKVLLQYQEHLKRNNNVEARNMKAVFIVPDIKTAKVFVGHINETGYHLPVGVFNPDHTQSMRAVYSTTNDGSNDDIIGDFQKDDNHILFVVNKGSRGVGTQFVSFVAFFKTYREKSIKTAIQASYRASVPVTLEHLRKRSMIHTSGMSPYDKKKADAAMKIYVRDQFGALSFPKGLFYKGGGRTSLVNIIKSVGFKMDPYLIEEGGIQDEVCGECKCVISMEETVKNEAGVHYHARCAQSENMEVVREDIVKIPVTEEDMKRIEWGFVSSIPKKDIVNHKIRKLEVLKEYIRGNGGTYSCTECNMEMCPEAIPVGLPKRLDNTMMLKKKMSLLHIITKKPTASTQYDPELDDIVRTPCKPRFIKLGGGDFSYRPTPCNSCAEKEDYAELDELCASSIDDSSSSDSDESIIDPRDDIGSLTHFPRFEGIGDSDESVCSEPFELRNTSDLEDQMKDYVEALSDEEEEEEGVSDDDSSSDDEGGIGPRRHIEVVSPPSIRIGPVENVLVIQSGPAGNNGNGISRALEHPSNMSSAEIAKTFKMSNEEMDRSSGSSSVKRKRTPVEEEVMGIVEPKRTTEGAMMTIVKDLVKDIGSRRDASVEWEDCMLSLGLTEERADAFHEFVLNRARSQGIDWIRVSDEGSTGNGVVVNVSGSGIMIEGVSLSGSVRDVLGVVGQSINHDCVYVTRDGLEGGPRKTFDRMVAWYTGRQGWVRRNDFCTSGGGADIGVHTLTPAVIMLKSKGESYETGSLGTKIVFRVMENVHCFKVI